MARLQPGVDAASFRLSVPGGRPLIGGDEAAAPSGMPVSPRGAPADSPRSEAFPASWAPLRPGESKDLKAAAHTAPPCPTQDPAYRGGKKRQAAQIGVRVASAGTSLYLNGKVRGKGHA